MKDEIGVRAERAPDFGPRQLGPAEAVVIGARPFLVAYNVYLNTGHGMLGWTLACGSARLLADLITQGTTDLELPTYAPDRA